MRSASSGNAQNVPVGRLFLPLMDLEGVGRTQWQQGQLCPQVVSAVGILHS